MVLFGCWLRIQWHQVVDVHAGTSSEWWPISQDICHHKWHHKVRFQIFYDFILVSCLKRAFGEWLFVLGAYAVAIGRYDFGLFLNFITGKQGLLCVTETWRYGYIRDY